MNKDNVYKFIIFSVIAFLAIYLISFCFCYNPHSWYDEGIYLHISRILEEYHIFGIQLGQNQFAPLNLITVGYPVFLPVATVFHFFGVGIAQARGVAIAFMILFLGIVYLYSSKYLGKFSAIASILLLLSFSPFYGNGRNVLGEIPGMFFLMMGVYFFEIFLEKKSKFKLIFAALFFSITMSTKPTFLIIGPILFFLLVIYLAKKKIKLNHFVIFFVSLIPPLVFWVITQFGGFTNIFKIFNHYANPYGLSDVIPVILNNIVRFFTESTPIHFLFLFLVVFIGIIVEFGKKKNLRFSTAFLFLFIGLMLLSYLRTPGWYRYFFPGHLVLLILFPYYLFIVFNFLQNVFTKLYKNNFYLLKFAPFILIAFLSIVQITYLFKNEMVCMKDGATIASEIINKNKYDNILFYNVPEVLARYNNEDYSQALRITEKIIIGKEQLDNLDQCRYNYVVLNQAHLATFPKLAECYLLENDLGNYQIWKKL